MTNNRISWVDTLKAIGILSVILGHIQTPFTAFIFSWHMPLFFFIAGFFIKYDISSREFITKDFKRLMIPYFIFSILALIIETLKRLSINKENLDYFFELKGIFLYMDYPNLINTYAFVLWFLPALFLGRFLIHLLGKKIKSIVMQLLIVSFLFYSSFHLDLYFAIDNAFNSALFIFLGSIFYKLYKDEKILYTLILIPPVLIFNFGIPNLNMALKIFDHVFINILFASSAIFILIKLVNRLHLNSKLITLWGANTMILFIIHPYTNHIGHIIFENDILYGNWHMKLITSLIILQLILFLKERFINRGIFKYV